MVKTVLAFGCGVIASAGLQAQAATAGLQINATQPGVAGPVCVRAIIQKSDGSYVPGEWGNPTWPAITMRGKAMGPTNVIQVPTGVTQVTIGKGPDYLPQTITTNLSVAGQTYVINVALQPVLDLYNQGWRAGDAHAHFIHGEGEVIRTPQDAFTMSAAGGFNFISFAEEHLGSGTLTRQQMFDQWTPYENSECKLWLGVEEPKNEWGHHVNILYDPWLIRSPVPYHWGIHSVHEQGGITFPVHTDRLYPGRYYDDTGTGRRQWFFFPANNHLKSYPLNALIGHLYDAWSGVSDQGYAPIKLPPYFKLLDMGYRIPYMADSDFCFDRVNNGEKGLGCWVTYYQLEGQPLTRAALINAIRKGRIMSTTGPLVLFTIDNAVSGDTLPADGAARTVRIQASHTFNPWRLDNLNMPTNDTCKVSEIDLYRNGQLIKTWNPNTPTATVTYTINESATNAYYMVRVLGNDSQWMAGYASPIYFDNAPRPRQPAVFKSLIQGRLYDGVSGQSVTGTVSSVRYGTTEWTIPTDSQGRFQAKVPIDAQLVARDSLNRQFTQDILQYEPAYSFCTYLSDNYLNNMVGSIDPFKNLVQTMRWEFPMGYQPSGSYVRTNLSGDGVMTNFSITSAPAATASKTNTEIVMILLDKTQAQIGDTIKYAVIFRQPRGQTPTEGLSAEWRGWDPNHPRMYNRYGTVFQYNDGASFLVNLGGGFFLRQGSVVVPSWTANPTETTAAIKLYVTVRAGSILEEAAVLVPIGPTKRELLVSSTWDGMPAGWGERGIGPCNFYREWTSFLVRYSDYRNLAINLTLNGQPITIQPSADTAHCADADDAIFYEHFYYDGQCEPQYRNIPFRDAVRTQPSAPDFTAVPIQDPPDTTAPTVVAIEPRDGDLVPAGAVRFNYSIDAAGLSRSTTAIVLVDDNPAATNATGEPISVNLSPGPHTWQVEGFDEFGNVGFSELLTLTATNGVTPPPDRTPPVVAITAPADTSTVAGSNVLVSANASDDVGVAGVQFILDDGNLASEVTVAPYAVNWVASSAGSGPHSLRAIARDAAGNRGTSDVVSVTVSNTIVTPPPVTNSDLIWFDDSLPAGAVPGSDGGDTWNWISANPAPYSGTTAHQSNLNLTNHQHFFSYASATFPVNTGDVLFAYVYLDPGNPPLEVMLQWNDGGWEHRAYWGASLNTFGAEGTASRRAMGALPLPGQWVRLEVPAGSVGLEGSTLKGMAFTLFGGKATWDYVGKRFSPLASIKKIGGTISLSWPSLAGQSYRVVCKTNLSSTNWTELSGPIAATNSPTTWIDTGVADDQQRFYRIVQ